MTDEDIVAALAEAMREARVGYYTTTAEILLPVVRRVAEQWAAAELLAAADWLDGDPDKGGAPYIAGDGSTLFPHTLEIASVVSWSSASLRDRAAALTATPNHGRNAT